MSKIEKIKVTLPHKFNFRSYQRDMWADMVEWTKEGVLTLKKLRGCLVWHRRSGKDKNALNFTVTMAYYHRVGTYAYFFPTYSQGKKIIWDGMDAKGFRFLDHFPEELIYDKNETEMQVILRHPDDPSKPGSVVQILGTDNIDRIVGMNIIGAVFSEYSLLNPKAWKYVQPMLRENGGWALFLFTPRGENHAYKLYKSALEHRDRWFVSLKTVADTIRDADGEPRFGEVVVSQSDIDDDIADGMDEETAQQEYYCSFKGSVHGSYYGRLMNLARDEARITRVPWNMHLPVFTAWDIGTSEGANDMTAIWFGQRMGEKIHWIDYYENDGEGLAHYAKIVNEKPYQYEAHWFPHDLKHKEWGASANRKRMAEDVLGSRVVRVIPKATIGDGIELVRKIIPVSYFDEVNCEAGLDALFSYKREWDDDNMVFKNKPLHNWASNAADAFRMGCTGYRPGVGRLGREGKTPPMKSNHDWNPFA